MKGLSIAGVVLAFSVPLALAGWAAARAFKAASERDEARKRELDALAVAQASQRPSSSTQNTISNITSIVGGLAQTLGANAGPLANLLKAF